MCFQGITPHRLRQGLARAGSPEAAAAKAFGKIAVASIILTISSEFIGVNRGKNLFVLSCLPAVAVYQTRHVEPIPQNLRTIPRKGSTALPT